MIFSPLNPSRSILLAAAVSLGIAAPLRAGRPEITVSGGGWALRPFTSVVENQCEYLIENLVVGRIGSIVPQLVSTTSQQHIDLTSSGAFLSFGVEVPIRSDEFWVGGAANIVRFDLPYSVQMKQSLSLGGVQVATADTRGNGTIHLRGIGASFSGRWDFYRGNRVRLGLMGGLNILPITGTADIQGSTDVSTPLGDLHLNGQRQEQLSNIREGIWSVPAAIVSPMVGVKASVRAGSRTSVWSQIVFSQGTFVSAGLGVSL